MIAKNVFAALTSAILACLFWFSPSGSDSLAPEFRPGAPSHASIQSLATQDGKLIAGASSGWVYRLDGEKWTRVEQLKGAVNLKTIGASLYAAGTAVFKSEADRWQQVGYIPETETVFLLFRHEDTMRAVGRKGIYELDAEEEFWNRVWEAESDTRIDAAAEYRGMLCVATSSERGTSSRGKVQCQAANRETQVKNFAGRVTDLTVIGDSLYGLVWQHRTGWSEGKVVGADVYRFDGTQWQVFTAKYAAERLLALDQTIYLGVTEGRFKGLYEFSDGRWQRDGNLRELCDFESVAKFGGKLYAGTSQGVWRLEGYEWKQVGTIESGLSDFALRNDTVYMATNRGLYVARGSVWDLWGDWGPCSRVLIHNSALYTTCYWGLVVTGLEERGLASPERKGEASTYETFLMVSESGDDVYAGTDYGVYKRESGASFQAVGKLRQQVTDLKFWDKEVYAATTRGAYRLDASAGKWTLLDDRLKTVPIATFSDNIIGDRFYIGTYTGQIWQYEVRGGRLSLLPDATGLFAQRSIRAISVRSPQLSLARDIIVAGTSNGLFWTNNGGTTWHGPFDLGSVSRILRNPKTQEIWIGSSDGLFHAEDKIPSELLAVILEKASQWAKEMWWLWVLVLLCASVFPNRFTLKVLSAAPVRLQKVYYLTMPFSRFCKRRLFRSHRNYFLKHPVVPVLNGKTTLQKAADSYVALPYQPPQDGKPVFEYVETIPEGQNVVWILGEGGLGKSLLLWRLKRDAFLTDKTPVLLDGFSFTSSMKQQVLNQLRRRQVPITPKLLEALLAFGQFIILFDGFSEIRDGYRSQAEIDIDEFVSKHPKNKYVFASRVAPPLNFLQEGQTARLLPVDQNTIDLFLSAYLPKRKSEVRQLRDAIVSTLKLTEQEWSPLMLAMIAEIYEQTGEVPPNRVDVYRKFSDQVLREEAIGKLSPGGIKFLLQVLTRDTLLKRGNRGSVESEVLEIFGKQRDKLKDEYGVKKPAEELLKILKAAGVLIDVSGSVRFWLDSFESYFAALYLLDRLRREKYQDVSSCYKEKQSGKLALAEVWKFFEDLVDESGEREKVRHVLEVSELAPHLEGSSRNKRA